jgi:hypothetical protein
MTTDAAAYPIQIELDYPRHQSRLITFFRYFLIAPHYVVLVVLLALAYVAILISFVAVLITGRYPPPLYAFVSGTLRWSMRVNGYMFLLTSRYPPFSLSDDPSYPIRIQYLRPERIGRLHVFNFILAIPMIVVMYAITILAYVVTVIAWFAAMILGRNPRPLWEVGAVWLAWQTRLSAYILWLTNRYPPLTWG